MGLLDILKYLTPVVLLFLAIGVYFLYRRQVERQAFESKLHFITDHTPALLAQCDLEKRYTFVNRPYAERFGLEPAELIGKHAREVLGEEAFAHACPYMDTALAGRSVAYDLEVQATSEEPSVFSVHYSPEYDESNSAVIGFIATITDISERKQAEETARKLAQAVEQAGEAILITNTGGIIEYVNPAFTRLTGYSAEEMLGENPRLINSGKQKTAFYEKMWDTILSGNTWQGKMTDRKKDGSFYPVMETISPIKNNEGVITHFVGHQQDLSENEALEQRFFQAQKLEALGTLVGGIAHEFNNSLAGVTGNLYLAKKGASQLPDVIQKLDAIEKLSFRSAALIKNLLSFSRQGIVQKTAVVLTPFLKEVIKIHRVSLPENIKLELNIDNTSLPMIINWDENLLLQVVLNLINNARDALTNVENALITINLSRYATDRDFLDKHPEIEAGNFACLSIRDNGIGINANDLPHIFEPFYTTKDVGKGTGLGLSIVTGAMQTHQGCIEVESIAGEGSVFHIYLPLLESSDVSPLAQPDELGEHGMDETILLVDDDTYILEVGKELLESLNYKVLVASDGLEAIEIFRANMDDVSIIITDIMMPKLGGVEAVERIRSIRPDMKVIFTTGYHKGEDRLKKIHDNNAIVLYKPFDIDDLSRVIRRQLET
ncbi:MAG: hypothetical protein CO187_01415 [Zetaproteobacteria bacterium CG_4_9_14_3_um_filter_53_7]|nr:MAG: hypothetical protein CO187_01415 [Zetaproteobacteria bacterium CG_4_9_14_3_um_filter_53_7]